MVILVYLILSETSLLVISPLYVSESLSGGLEEFETGAVSLTHLMSHDYLFDYDNRLQMLVGLENFVPGKFQAETEAKPLNLSVFAFLEF